MRNVLGYLKQREAREISQTVLTGLNSLLAEYPSIGVRLNALRYSETMQYYFFNGIKLISFNMEHSEILEVEKKIKELNSCIQPLVLLENQICTFMCLNTQDIYGRVIKTVALGVDEMELGDKERSRAGRRVYFPLHTAFEFCTMCVYCLFNQINQSINQFLLFLYQYSLYVYFQYQVVGVHLVSDCCITSHVETLTSCGLLRQCC